MTIINCTECAGFNEVRPATVTADYWDGQGEETLCDSCASNRWVYHNIRPLGAIDAELAIKQCTGCPACPPKGDDTKVLCTTCKATEVIWGDKNIEPTCIPCILAQAANRLASDRRTLTKATGRTW